MSISSDFLYYIVLYCIAMMITVHVHTTYYKLQQPMM